MDVPTASGNIMHLVAATHVGEFHHAVSAPFWEFLVITSPYQKIAPTLNTKFRGLQTLKTTF